MAFSICAGFREDGRLGEIFLSSNRPGSSIEALARDAAVVTSLALQFGCPVEVIRHALTKDADGGPATLLGAVLSALAIVDLEAPVAESDPLVGADSLSAKRARRDDARSP
jgi:hypothetical protein